MSEASNQNNNLLKNFVKKLQKFLTFLAMIFAVILLGFWGFKHLEALKNQKQNAQARIEKFDNVDSEIFDLSDDAGNPEAVASEIAVNELKERGAEFVYKALLKHQIQIDDLRNQTKNLQSDFAKYKSQEKIAKTVFAYVDLRQAFLAGKDHEEELKNFEMLSAFDPTLYAKVSNLKTLLPKFLGEEQTLLAFKKLIPEIIVNKNISENSRIIDKVYRNISKLVIIRKTTEKGGNDVDSVIVRSEKLLQDKKYREASEALLLIDETHHEILQNFLDNLSASTQLQELDLEIVNYLKSLQ